MPHAAVQQPSEHRSLCADIPNHRVTCCRQSVHAEWSRRPMVRNVRAQAAVQCMLGTASEQAAAQCRNDTISAILRHVS
jgi:hypothetical protein